MIIDIVEEKIPRSIKKSVYQLLAQMYDLDSPDDFDFPDYKDFYEFIDSDIDESGHILIYGQDGKAVGCLYLNNYEYVNETFYKNGCMQFSNLYVLPDYRCQGIASKLMQYAEELAKEDEISIIISDYKETNKQSEGVHKKNGFKVLDKKIQVIKEI